LEKNNAATMIKIAISGPESTGKSFLAEALAKHYDTVWVKEFARDYLNQIQRPYTFDDIGYIAQQQAYQEMEQTRDANNFLFCDTDMLVCKIWQEFVFGKISDEVETLFQNTPYHFTLLCDIDLPWEPDPLREHPDNRAELLEMYINNLNRFHRPYAIIKGLGEERVRNAVEVLKNEFGKTRS
jgi:nicotinamide riboside kinase